MGIVAKTYTVAESTESVKANVFSLANAFILPVSLMVKTGKDPQKRSTTDVNVPYSQVSSISPWNRPPFFGNRSVLGYKGRFGDRLKSVRVSGLWVCFGLIIAAKDPKGVHLTDFTAYHFAGIKEAWETGFEKFDDLSMMITKGDEETEVNIKDEIKKWNGTLYAVGATGFYPQREKGTLSTAIKGACKKIGVSYLTIFYARRYKKLEVSGTPNTKVSLELHKNGGIVWKSAPAYDMS